MALKYSSMLDLGTAIPEFELVNVLDGLLFSSDSLKNSKPSLIMVRLHISIISLGFLFFKESEENYR